MSLREQRMCAQCRGHIIPDANGLMPEHTRKPRGATPSDYVPVRCTGSGEPPDYSQMYWEDFCCYVVQAGKPYTRRSMEGVIQNYVQGVYETYDEGSETDGADKEARDAIEEDAKKHNNPPREIAA